MGSLFELETQLIIIKELHLINIEELDNLFSMLDEEAKMINGLLNKLKAKS